MSIVDVSRPTLQTLLQHPGMIKVPGPGQGLEGAVAGARLSLAEREDIEGVTGCSPRPGAADDQIDARPGRGRGKWVPAL
jgi:hypothetical protein